MCPRKLFNPKNEWKLYHRNKGKGGVEGKKIERMEKSGFLLHALCQSRRSTNFPCYLIEYS